jgi:ABC-type polysaccharide/polyol phosphate transport system ATPase subunit
LPATLSQTEAQRADALARAPAAVTVDGVSKSFRLPHQQYQTLKERVLHPFRSSTYETLHALRAVSFDVRAGEFFGIVGRNGSGKSTLLKCLAGIYDVDPGGGRIGLGGRLSPFIELGVGFNPDLTARDNVTINAIMLGLTRREAHRRFDQIIAFAELEDFVDLKLKNYSSGMAVRLAFSVAIQVDADIILVDEVLAVGDVSFQEKCFEQFRRLKEEGRTVLFVTHDMALVERFCDRAMLLHHGELVDIGDPAAVAEHYFALNFDAEGGEAPGRTGPLPERPAEIVRAWWEDELGQRVYRLEHGQSCTASVEVRFGQRVEDPTVVLRLLSDVGAVVFGTSTVGTPVGRFGPGESGTVRVSFDFRLPPGRYALTVTLSPDGEEETAWERREGLAPITVQGSSRALPDMPHELEVIRGAPSDLD